jgi:hypothetical protein
LFLRLLPAIRKHARIAFRHLDPESREEGVQAVVCNACCAVARLAELNKLDLCYASVLARFAVAQVNDGRMTGGRLNCRDVASRYCQRKKGITVERLDHFDDEENAWCEVLVEDRTAGPAEIARTRIDFDAWLHQLPRRNRRIAQFLSLGNRTSDAARKFAVSQGRVSQVRKELAESWNKFTSEAEGGGVAA